MSLLLQSQSELFVLPNQYIDDAGMNKLRADLSGEFNYQYYFDEFNQIRLRQPKEKCKALLKLFKLDINDVEFIPAECKELYNILKDVETVNSNKELNILKNYLASAYMHGYQLHIFNENYDLYY